MVIALVRMMDRFDRFGSLRWFGKITGLDRSVFVLIVGLYCFDESLLLVHEQPLVVSEIIIAFSFLTRGS